MNNGDKINILLVDDRRENLIALQGILEREDLNIVTAGSGNVALALMMEVDFALVLLDVQMPTMDGFETAEIMRKNKKTQNIPIIFVTAISTEKKYMSRGYELGAVDYICKPVEPDILLNKVNALLALEVTRRDLKRTVEELTREISKREKTEEELRQYEEQTIESNKMKAVGTLAGGIAHKFNNALSAIKGNIELLRMDYPHHREILEFIHRMSDSVSEMSGLTSKLIAYAEGGKYNPKQIDVCPFIEETLSLIRHQVKPAVNLEMVQSGHVHEIEADMTQMQMALTAVIMNGVEAIDGIGNVVVSAKNDTYEPLEEESVPGEYVCISVEDNGRGMENEIKARVFEPFFTTNLPGRGLGMAAVYGIVRNHNGHIYIDSDPGSGTLVKIWLPAVKKQSAAVAAKKSADKTKAGTVLLIEDEEIVMEVNTAMIKKLGYTVLPAETGTKAIAVAETYEGKIDLAILDLALPDMKGTSVFPHLIKARPEIKVIVCSGYSIESGAKELLDKGAHGFLQKPFSFATLAGLLRENINRRKHKRVELEDGYFLDPAGNKIKIIDISEGGFSFLCYKDESTEDGGGNVAVIISEKGYDISSLEYEIVSEDSDNKSGPDEGIVTKRKGVAFINLNEEQSKELQKFINSCLGNSRQAEE